MREATKPIAQGKPAEKVCEDLKKKDTQICELQYGTFGKITITPPPILLVSEIIGGLVTNLCTCLCRKGVAYNISLGNSYITISCDLVKVVTMYFCHLSLHWGHLSLHWDDGSTEQQIDLNTVDFKTLRVKDLKKILNDLGGECKGCTEKRDFIDKIEQIKTKKEL